MKTIKVRSIIAATIGLTIIATSVCRAQIAKSGYAPVNGIKMYYEVYGQGDPIVLLHGSFMNINTNFRELIPKLAKTHQVIAIELQGHGRTADTDRPISYPALASDVAGLLNYLKIDSANILGYSMGSTVALQLAIQKPKLVKKVIFISSVYKLDGWIKQVRDAFSVMTADMLSQTPLKTGYEQLAPDKTHWRAFVTKMIKFENTPFDLGIENIRKMKSPILIIRGDNDGIDYAHTTELYQACGGGVFGDMMPMPKSRLAVVPCTTHVTLMMQTSQLTDIILPFLQ